MKNYKEKKVPGIGLWHKICRISKILYYKIKIIYYTINIIYYKIDYKHD